jgi:hypothetical protein
MMGRLPETLQGHTIRSGVRIQRWQTRPLASCVDTVGVSRLMDPPLGNYAENTQLNCVSYAEDQH